MSQIDDITLLKFLGKGSFGEVYLSTKRGKKELFATKKMKRAECDKPSIKKYFENEIRILDSLKHPNIVKLEDLKTTKDHYYIVMEYINGGSLTDCLKGYQKKNGRSFSEDIVQYLMKQTVDAIRYIHSKKIIHRDLKLDNIMVSFDNENDKNNLDMMKAKIKIIDFGFAIRLTKSALAYSALGSPINMDPLILKKFTKKGGNINQLGYDSKADIWSLGTICYEMLIGQAVFNAETMNELIKKVETGSYRVPTSVSAEVVSFLNGMLQYNPENRLNAEELARHPFLNKRVSDFTKINTKQVSRKVDNKGLNINIKKNATIWAIFNEEDEKKLVNIKGGRDLPAAEGPINEEYIRNKRSNTEKTIPRMNNINKNNFNNINKQNIQPQNQYPNFNNYGSGNSFYGQNMHANIPNNMNPYPNRLNHRLSNPLIQQSPGMMPGMMPMNQMPNMVYNNPTPMMNYPTFGVPMGFSNSGGIYSLNNNGVSPPSFPSPNYPGGINTMNNNNVNRGNQFTQFDDDEIEQGNVCSIQ